MALYVYILKKSKLLGSRNKGDGGGGGGGGAWGTLIIDLHVLLKNICNIHT